MKNIFRVLTTLCVLFASSQLVAQEAGEQGNSKSSNLFVDSEWGLGMYYSTPSDEMIPYLSLNYKMFTAGFGMSVNHGRSFTDINGNEQNPGNSFNYSWHLGMRMPIAPKFFASMGGQFWYASAGGSDTDGNRFKDPYVVGPYIGLDYYLNKSLMLKATLCPYALERNSGGGKADTYFQNGIFGISYIF
jgi:hypothetical protein